LKNHVASWGRPKGHRKLKRGTDNPGPRRKSKHSKSAARRPETPDTRSKPKLKPNS